MMKIRINRGKAKCNVKNNFNVYIETKNPPQIQYTTRLPTTGMTVNRFLITVAPHNLICPQGSTYPINAIIIIPASISQPETQTSFK
jgi:hypothetical protein